MWFQFWLCSATGLEHLGPPLLPTQLFSLGSNRTCLQPTPLPCPPHTWKQSAFLPGAVRLAPPLSLTHQQPTLSSSTALIPLLTLVFSSSPPAPLSHRCSPGTRGTSERHPNVCAHTHMCMHFNYVPKLLPLVFSSKNKKLGFCGGLQLFITSPTIAFQMLSKDIVSAKPTARTEPRRWYQLLAVS